METPCRLPLLGAEVDIVTPACVLDFVAETVISGERRVVANHNLHSLYLYQRHAHMRDFYAKADLIEIDSTPMIAWGRLLGLPMSLAHRCTYLDYRDEFWTLATTHGWRVYHIGGAPDVIEASRTAILARYPDVHLDVHTGYFDVDGEANDGVLRDLADKKPDVLLVGMGMPRQEIWILKNYDRLPKCVILPVGGAFDYEAGLTYTPPRWTARFGMEWFVRFVHDPARLFERYFVEPWFLLPQILRDLTGRGRRAAEQVHVPTSVQPVPLAPPVAQHLPLAPAAQMTADWASEPRPTKVNVYR